MLREGCPRASPVVCSTHLTDHLTNGVATHLFYPGRRRATTALRALIDHLRENPKKRSGSSSALSE